MLLQLLASNQFPPKSPPPSCSMAIDHPRSSFLKTYFPIICAKVRKIVMAIFFQDVTPKENATLYHYFPHNQHLFQLPDCASQQVVPFLVWEVDFDFCQSLSPQLEFSLTQVLCPFPAVVLAGVQCSLPPTQLLRPTLRLP